MLLEAIDAQCYNRAMEIGKRILLLSENGEEARTTARTLRKWGWEHVIVCSDYREVIRKLKSNPFSYAIVVVEKVYPAKLEEKLVRSILEAHPRIPIIIRSEYGEIREHVGRVTYLRADRYDFDDLVDRMEEIYRDERFGYQSNLPLSLWKLKSKATDGQKVFFIKNNNRKAAPPDPGVKK